MVILPFGTNGIGEEIIKSTSNGYLYFQDTRMMPISLIENISIVDEDNILANEIKYYSDLKVEEETK